MATIHPISASVSDRGVRQNELTAMRSIVAMLEELADDQARVRVIRWAAETFGLSIAGQAGARPAAFSNGFPSVDPADPTLTIDGIDEFFDRIADSDPHRDEEWGPHARVELPEAFPDDEWEERPLTAVAVPAISNEGVVSMLHVFVADFQRLARDWSDNTESADRRIE